MRINLKTFEGEATEWATGRGGGGEDHSLQFSKGRRVFLPSFQNGVEFKTREEKGRGFRRVSKAPMSQIKL